MRVVCVCDCRVRVVSSVKRTRAKKTRARVRGLVCETMKKEQLNIWLRPVIGRSVSKLPSLNLTSTYRSPDRVG